MHHANEAKALSWQCFDEALFVAGIADRASGSIETGRQRHVRYDASIPDGADEIIFADDALPVADQVIEQIKNLRCRRNHVGAAMELAPVGIERVILEEIAHGTLPWVARRSSASADRLEHRISRR